MKYALLFAATAAAYDAYGGYGDQLSSASAKVSSAVKISSSAPGYGGQSGQTVTLSGVKSSSASEATPCSTSVGKNAYTTVSPGYGKTPVTVTAQHQAYPSCVARGYDGKGCDKWVDDKYVSTTITDCNKKVVTITRVQDSVTVYQEKKTITHYATPTIGGYGALSTGTSSRNATGTWFELYEKIHVVEYQNMGKHALVGYNGSGLCNKCDDVQEVVIKEYKGGKWTEEKKTLNYGKPKDEVKIYEKPGVYTVPAKVVTVYASTPSGKAPEAGVYSYEAKVITITKPNQPYTCTYELPKQTPSNTPSEGGNYPATVTKTPSHDSSDHGHTASAIHQTPGNNYSSYPSYPVQSNTTSVYERSSVQNPTSTPCSVSSKSAHGDNGYAAKSTPTPASSSKPVNRDNGYVAKSTPIVSSASKPVYGGNGYIVKSTPAVSSASKPTYGDNAYGIKPTPSASAYGNNAYKATNPSSSSPSKPSSTPCDEDTKTPTPTPAKPVYSDSSNATLAPATPSKASYENSNNNGYGANSKPTPTPAKAVYASDPSSGYSSATEYGKTNTGYTKRGGMIERRNAITEVQKTKRAIVL